MMEIIELKKYDNEIEIYRDGAFDIFAQCIVKLDKKIITFFDDKKYLNDLLSNPFISCVICTVENVSFIPEDKGIIITDEPRYTFFKLFNLLMNDKKKFAKTKIGKNVTIGKNVCISKNNVEIGNNVTIGNNTVIESNTKIEDNVVIGSNCVIGSEGFEVKRRKDKTLFPVSHFGSVLIKEKTVIKSMVSIHKSVFDWDTTTIGKNCVIDSLTHIAHGNHIGNYILIGAHCTISGNCLIEDYACVDLGSCIAKRITIGKNSKVSIGSVVTKNVMENTTVTGNFAIAHEKWIEFVKQISK